MVYIQVILFMIYQEKKSVSVSFFYCLMLHDGYDRCCIAAVTLKVKGHESLF